MSRQKGLAPMRRSLVASAVMRSRGPSVAAFACALFVLALTAPAHAGFVDRGVDKVAWAIGQSNGSLGKDARRIYAKLVIKEARKHDFDPFTAVAIAHSESRWRPSAISPDGEDYGLGQIRARYQPGCRDDADPVHHPDAECKAAKARLLSPAYNLSMMGSAITAWRKLCKDKKRGTGRPALFHRWLAGYGGMHRPKAGIRCGQKKVKGKWRDMPLRPRLRRIINHRKRLIALARRRRK